MKQNKNEIDRVLIKKENKKTLTYEKCVCF